MWGENIMGKRNYLFLFVVLILSMVIAACSGQDGKDKENGEKTNTSSGGKDENTLIVGMDDDPPQLDPHFSTAAVDRQVYHSIYDKLIDIDDTLSFVPQLAKDWEISEDGKTYTFLLQEGVTFHDGYSI